MQRSDKNRLASWFFPLASFALVVAILRFAQDVLLPVAFAALLAFLLSPLVVRLMRWGLPKPVAIVTTVIVAFTIIGGVGWIVTTQALGLLRELPNYEQNIHRKVAALKQPHTPASASRLAGMIDDLRKQIQAPAAEKTALEPQPNSPAKPVPVEIHPADSTPLELAREIGMPILRRLAVAGIVIVFVVAILFQREDLRDRFITLAGAGQLHAATQAIDDAAARVSRYLVMQLVVNATYGVPIGVGLYFIGIPNALLWGLLATLLRFIPFVGSWIAAVFPLALAVAIDPGWTKVLSSAGLFVVMELISSNVVEILLYGASTGISNFALLAAAVFWTWLWGPAGLVLSTPLTVCLLVLGTHVPGLKFLRMLLGNQPALDPPTQFYQRMLSMESEDMLEVANKFIVDRSLDEFYDDVFVPALLLSEEDRHSGALEEARQEFIFQSSRELIEELERQEETAKLQQPPDSAAPFPAPQPASPVVLGVPARDPADEVVALMLCHLLRRRGVAAAAMSLSASPDDVAGMVTRHRVRALVISALPPSAVVGARQTWRRLHAHCAAVPTVVGIWRHDAAGADLTERLRVVQPVEVVTSLAAAIERLEKILALAPPAIPSTAAGEKNLRERP